MKTTIVRTASLLMVFGLFLTFQNSNAQDQKLTRQEKKEIRKAQMTTNFHILDTLLNIRAFVLEADYLEDSNGHRESVTPNLNFIRVEGDRGILQTGANSGLGLNGVGGVTAQGTVDGWDLNKDTKNLTYTLRFGLLTNIGHYDVLMIIRSDTYASATITGLWPGKLIWAGRLNTLDRSRVFKGQDTH